MSVGIRDVAPPMPPLEHVLWTLRKDTRVARAVVRIMAHGRELRVSVGDVLFFSRLYRTDEDGRELGARANGTLQNFEGHGWTRDAEA